MAKTTDKWQQNDQGGNTTGLTCAIDRVSRIPYMQKTIENRYSFGRQPNHKYDWSKAVSNSRSTAILRSIDSFDSTGRDVGITAVMTYLHSED